MVDYSPYENFVQYICETRNFTDFKTHPNYKYMLEHVSPELGHKYLELIQNNTTITSFQIESYCNMNDIIGNPTKINYGTITCSPTSLRYIWFSHVILSHFKKFNKDTYDIVEIGGGYGGLCLALNFFSKHYSLTISNYAIIDLTWPSKLQKLYLDNFNISFPVSFHTATTYGENINTSDSMLISTYSFSEIDFNHQKNYIEKLFPKISHGFIAWNLIPTYDFGFEFTEEKETPLSFNDNPYNKFVFF